MPDHYGTLGVARSASPSEIQVAVDRLNSSGRTPRSWGTNPPPSARAIAEAQYWLGDAARRREYDLTLALPESMQADANRQVGRQQASGEQTAAGRKLRSPVVQPAPPAHWRKAGAPGTNESADRITMQIVWLVLAALSVWGAVAGYGWLNNLGWIEHGKNVSVQIDGNWMMGEYRPCRLYPAPEDLECTQRLAGAAHLLPVTFWGRIDRNESSDWKCQRQHGVLTSTDSVVCWATD